MTTGQPSEPLENLHTVLDFLRWGLTLFEQSGCHYGHGTDNPKDDAAALLCYALHMEPEQLPLFQNAKLLPSEKEKLIHLFNQRADQHIPVPYLTNQIWFAGLSFYIDERVLIPRSPMAELVENGFSPWINTDEIRSVLDIGTGSGCIAVASALYCAHTKVDALDIDADALEVAKINVQHYALEDRVTLIQSDLFKKVQGRRYDVIVSNPPYVPHESMLVIPREYTHEPAHALSAGADGLAYVIPLLNKAFGYLEPGGVLFVEVGEAAQALAEKFPHIDFTWLEFERGGEGVFMLEYEQLRQCHHCIRTD